MEIMRMNKKGQSSITDALFFLLIVSILAALLFFFTLPFGTTIRENLDTQYKQDYITSAMETILYSSVSRDPSLSLEDADEVDYLMTAFNEDYADDMVIDEVQEVMRNNIVAIMKPVSPTYNYLFYMYVPTGTGGLDNEFIFTILYRSKYIVTGEGRTTEVESGGTYVYYCSPVSGKTTDSGISVILNELLPKVSNKAQANSRFQFGQANEDPIPSYAVLVMWTAANLDDDLINNRLKCDEATAFKIN